MTLTERARDVLLTASATEKAEVAHAVAAEWRLGNLAPGTAVELPDHPARPARPQLVPPNRMPKRGRAGTVRTRIAMLHAVAHIELNAIDLAADIVARFGPEMPREFSDDWVRVLDEEATHFLLLSDHLQTLGAEYGDLPAHDGLWQASRDTRDDLAARLAIIPQVLEARGLDVTPAMIERFLAAGDVSAALILTRILEDEVGHVATGNRWFRIICGRYNLEPSAAFHAHVRKSFRGQLKAPFNDSSRTQAGLSADWYMPLAAPEQPC